jgi:hypothetical protein
MGAIVTITRPAFTDNDTLDAQAANQVWIQAATVPSATDAAEGVIQLAGDLAGTALAPEIGAHKVTLGKMQQIASDKLLGRATAGNGAVELIDCSPAGRALLAYGWSAQAASFTAEPMKRYWVTGNDVVVTLPANPSEGDLVEIASGAAVTGCTIARNGKTIMGFAQDMSVGLFNFWFTLVYRAATGDWRLA